VAAINSEAAYFLGNTNTTLTMKEKDYTKFTELVREITLQYDISWEDALDTVRLMLGIGDGLIPEQEEIETALDQFQNLDYDADEEDVKYDTRPSDDDDCYEDDEFDDAVTSYRTNSNTITIPRKAIEKGYAFGLDEDTDLAGLYAFPKKGGSDTYLLFLDEVPAKYKPQWAKACNDGTALEVHSKASWKNGKANKNFYFACGPKSNIASVAEADFIWNDKIGALEIDLY